MKKNIKNILIFLLIGYCTLFLILNTHEVGKYVSNSVERCILVIIPSLFAMMAMSGIIIKSGLTGSANLLIIFIISMVSGYPVGAKMLTEEFERGNLSKKQTELYMSVCFGAGTSFIFGCVSDILFSGSNAGIIILISTISVNFIALIILLIIDKKKPWSFTKPEIKFNSEIFVNSVISGGRNIFSMCIMIIFFSVFTCIMEKSGLILSLSEIISGIINTSPDTCKSMIESIAEVTNISTIEKNNYTLLPFVCFGVSFGGVCVMLQIKAVINKELSMIPFIVIRTACAAASGIVCRIIMPFMLKGQTISVSAEIKSYIYSASSPVPSYMLIIMIIMLLWSFRENIN